MRSKAVRSVRDGLPNMGWERAKSNWLDEAASAGAARPGEAAGIKEVLGADRPPRVRRFRIRSEDQELIVAVHAGPDDHDRQVARAVRLGPELLGGEPKRIDVR